MKWVKWVVLGWYGKCDVAKGGIGVRREQCWGQINELIRVTCDLLFSDNFYFFFFLNFLLNIFHLLIFIIPISILNYFKLIVYF